MHTVKMCPCFSWTVACAVVKSQNQNRRRDCNVKPLYCFCVCIFNFYLVSVTEYEQNRFFFLLAICCHLVVKQANQFRFTAVMTATTFTKVLSSNQIKLYLCHNLHIMSLGFDKLYRCDICTLCALRPSNPVR